MKILLNIKQLTAFLFLRYSNNFLFKEYKEFRVSGSVGLCMSNHP